MALNRQLANLPDAITTDTSNNVGIGGSPSGSYKLDVTGTGRFTGALITNSTSFPLDIYGTTNNYGLRINNVQAATLFLYSSNANAANRNWGLFTNSQVYGDFDIRQSNAINGDLTNGANSTSRFYIKNDGNVGIGTSSPSYTLEVNANAATWATRIYNASSTGLGLVVSTNNTTTAAGFALYNGSGYVLYARNDGNVGINTSSPAYTLEVAGTFKVGGSAYFTGSVYNYVGGSRFFAQGGGNNYLYSGTTNITFVNQADTATLATINGTTGVYTALSDINKKKDFELSTIGLNEILQLKPTLYRFKSEDETASKQLGFIAQEVKEFIPQAYEESGEDENKFIGLQDRPILAAVVKAIQELSAKNEELSNRLIKLESK